MESTILCNMMHTLEQISTAIFAKRLLKLIEKKISVDVWKVLSSKLASPEKRQTANQHDYSMAVSSFDRYRQDVLGPHLNEGYNFTDQLEDTESHSHIEGKRSVTKMLQFFKSEIKLIKSLCGKLEKFLEDRNNKITQNAAKLDADSKADEEENTLEMKNSPTKQIETMDDNAIGNKCLALLDRINSMFTIACACLSLFEILAMKTEYGNLQGHVSIAAAQFIRIVLPLLQRILHETKYPNLMRDYIFPKTLKGLQLNSPLSAVVCQCIWSDVLLTAMDFVIFPKKIKLHDAGVRCLQLAPPSLIDPNLYILSGGDDRAVKITKIDENNEAECVANFEGFLSIVSYCTFIPPNNKFIFATSFDCNAHVWDAYSGRLIVRLEGHTDSILDGSVSKDGKLALTSSMDGIVRLWCLQTYRCLRIYKHHAHKKWIKCVQFCFNNAHPDYFYTAGLDNRLVIAKAVAPKVVKPAKKKDYRTVSKMKVNSWTKSRGKKNVFSVNENMSFEVDEKLEAGDLVVKDWKASTDYILKMCTNEDGSILAFVSKDHMVNLYDGNTNVIKVQEKNASPTWASCLCISPDGQYIATGSSDNYVCIYRAENGTCLRVIRVHMQGLNSITFLQDNTMLLLGCASGAGVFVDLE